MSPTTRIFLSLVRAALWGTPLEDIAPDQINWQEMERLCTIHQLGPMVFDQLLRLPLPEADKKRLQQRCALNMMQQAGWQPIIERVWQLLSPEMTPVLMKGFVLASHYQRPHLRQWGDLDLWCGVEHYHRACTILREGVPHKKIPGEEFEELKHYGVVMPDGHAIELHRVTMEFASKRDWHYWQRLELEGMTEPLPRMQVGSCQVAVPEEKFNLIFTFIHSWEHFCGTGIPIKQLCDLALLARDITDRPAMEAYLRRHLKALHLYEVWQSVGYAVTTLTGLPAEQWPLGVEAKHGQRMVDDILRHGLYRPRQKAIHAASREEANDIAQRMPVLKRKFLTLTIRIKDGSELFPFAPRYAWHHLMASLWRGIRRTIRRERMIDWV